VIGHQVIYSLRIHFALLGVDEFDPSYSHDYLSQLVPAKLHSIVALELFLVVVSSYEESVDVMLLDIPIVA
jgi:hypothetical protein